MDKIDKVNRDNKKELFNNEIEIKTKYVENVRVGLTYWKEYIEVKPPMPTREYKGNTLTVSVPPPSKWNHIKHKNKHELMIYFGKSYGYLNYEGFNLDLVSWIGLKKEVEKLIKSAQLKIKNG